MMSADLAPHLSPTTTIAAGLRRDGGGDRGLAIEFFEGMKISLMLSICAGRIAIFARAVMEKSEHVFLIGEGAERLAREHGISFEDVEYFLTEARIAQLAEAKKKQAIVLDHSQANERKLGTVGAVARDRSGNLAAATSTGGVVNQQWGRVGDSAIIGAGVFADNASCAVSCTGIGEHLLRTSLAKTAALFVEYRGVRADEAADAAIRYLVDKVHGLGGLITATAHAREPIRHRACSPQRPRTASYAYRRRSRQHATAVPAALRRYARAPRCALAQLLYAQHAVRAVGAQNPIIVWPLRNEADLFVAIGTSSSVYPAAGFVSEARALGIPHLRDQFGAIR